jgi:hypothetical protein
MSEQTKRCRSCNAPIFFAKTRSGSIPLDAEPDPQGKVVVVETERGLEAFFPPKGVEIPGAVRYRSHLGHCPHTA